MASANISNLDPQFIVYPKNKDKCQYSAIGIFEISLTPSNPRLNEKCVFSQFKLSECNSISAIVYSNTGANQANKFKFLCGGSSIDICNFNSINASSSNLIHLFDSDYLKEWIKLKGVEFIHCPLCKTGWNDEQKEHIEEHDIDTMEQLRDRRRDAKKNNDEYMCYHIEQLILDKASITKYNINTSASGNNTFALRIHFNCDLLREVLNHWIIKKKVDTFRNKIIESINKCCKNDNIKILKIILKHCGYNMSKNNQNIARNNEIISFINNASSYGSLDCCKLLLKNPSLLDWSQQKRPICLFNAVKYTRNIDLITFIIDSLETLHITFVCDDIMREIIRYDLDVIAKRIVNLRWHKISDNDIKLAKSINLNCNIYFYERSKAFDLYNTSNNNNNNGYNGSLINIDQWDDNDDDDNNNNNNNDDDDWDDDDDDDWANDDDDNDDDNDGNDNNNNNDKDI